jgi:hypothetical protein
VTCRTTSRRITDEHEPAPGRALKLSGKVAGKPQFVAHFQRFGATGRQIWVILGREFFPMKRGLGRTLVTVMGLSLVSACGAETSGAEHVESPPRLEAASGRQPRAQKEESLSATDVLIKLRGNETDIRRCFFANPSAHGTLSLSWNVTTEGRVARLKRQSSTLSDPRIETCLTEKLYELRFDAREKPARAQWTFVFRLVEPHKDRRGRIKSPNKRQRDRAEAHEQGVQLEKGSEGSLDLADVEDVVEAGFPLFARCYRDGVQRSSSLDGAVRLRFVVAEDGSVAAVEDGGSDLTDRQVVDCVAEGFYALRFPHPERGPARLLYRIHFDAG